MKIPTAAKIASLFHLNNFSTECNCDPLFFKQRKQKWTLRETQNNIFTSREQNNEIKNVIQTDGYELFIRAHHHSRLDSKYTNSAGCTYVHS
mmetsp:Transcript_21945/g.45934  ORF Transcript_21945/g.45934 Transcript_21945/m.45934 type:complete len:92 (+) Transcript_21945:38-313(+)